MDQQALLAHIEKYKQTVYGRPGCILNPEKHYRLVQDLVRITAQANIPAKYVYSSMKGSCGEREVDWVKSLRKHVDEDIIGLCFTGTTPKLEDRMMAIAGACIRNFIDARVFTVQEVIQRLKEDNLPEPRVLLIPNFFLKKDSGGDIPSWQVSSLMGLLFNRFSKGLQTVLYAQSLHDLGDTYGPAFRTHIEGHFTIIQSNK